MDSEKQKESTPEKNTLQFFLRGLKKLILLGVTIFTFMQMYDYIGESPKIVVYLENANKGSNYYTTKIDIRNGSESFTSNDIVEPLTIFFNEDIDSIIQSNSNIDPMLLIKNNSVKISLKLFNKNEKFSFLIRTKNRPDITKLEYRIKNIEKIEFFDFQNKPLPLNRLFNFWIIILILSILFGIDGLIVVLKDRELYRLKQYVSKFPLNQKNSDKFISGFNDLYKEYKLRFKPDPVFMEGVIKNLFKSFPCKTEDEIHFIKVMANVKTEMYIFYRTRVAFLIMSPYVIILSVCALILNYVYFETTILNQNISLQSINKILLTLFLVITIAFILFPSRIINFLFLKKGATIKF